MRKEDNQYLKTITKKLGVTYNARKPNNTYLKVISEKITGGGAGNLDFIELEITYEDGSTEIVNFATLEDSD